MRPASILMFERLFLASIAVSVVSLILTYDQMVVLLQGDPAMSALGISGGLVIGMAVAGYALYLLLWFFIAHKASNVAKWILVFLIALSLVSVLTTLAGPWDLMLGASLLIYALQAAAVIYLFRDDAVAWLKGKRTTDPATFD